MLYLTNRAIGLSAMTREYVFTLKEAGVKMPRGPLLLQVDSLVGALQTEVREEWNLQKIHVLNMNYRAKSLLFDFLFALGVNIVCFS